VSQLVKAELPLKNLKMTKRKYTIQRSPKSPNLIIQRTEAERKIYNRVTLGNKLLDLSIHNENDLDAAIVQRKKWNDYNVDLLGRLFDSKVVLEDYNNQSSRFDQPIIKESWSQKISSFYEGISCKINALESIIKRLEFIPEKIIISETQEKYETGKSDTVLAAHALDDKDKKTMTEQPEFIPEKDIESETQQRYETGKSDTVLAAYGLDDKDKKTMTEQPEFISEKVIASETQEKYKPENRGTVFVVHGEDDEGKNAVATYIEKLGLKVVVLHEQRSAGKTIIEILDRNAAISDYAVVILTSDDSGVSKKNTEDTTLQTRLNVMLELGYFCGALGKKRVSVLTKAGVYFPGDFLGVESTLFDPGGNWQLSLARDMKSAGLSFDANRIF